LQEYHSSQDEIATAPGRQFFIVAGISVSPVEIATAQGRQLF
jgi:hypothetical protein